MRPEVLVGPLKALLDRLSSEFGAEAARAKTARERFAIALSGGSVGAYGFPALARVPLDWDVTHVFWVDERAVPPSSPDSNFRLAMSLWLDSSAASPSSIHRMPADNPNLDEAATLYAAELRQVGRGRGTSARRVCGRRVGHTRNCAFTVSRRTCQLEGNAVKRLSQTCGGRAILNRAIPPPRPAPPAGCERPPSRGPAPCRRWPGSCPARPRRRRGTCRRWR